MACISAVIVYRQKYDTLGLSNSVYMCRHGYAVKKFTLEPSGLEFGLIA